MNYSRIILITVDCLRASAIHCLGGHNITENIDKLAKNGILFKQAMANGPGTPQSFPAIFTSTYPLMHKKIMLSSKYVTLAEILTKNGFTCAGFHSNPFLSKFFGWDRGFETFNDSFQSIETPSNLILDFPPQLRLPISKMVNKVEDSRVIEKLVAYVSRFYNKTKNRLPYLPGEKMNNLVFEWLKKCKSQRSFLWIHYMDPHSPYVPSLYKPRGSIFHQKRMTSKIELLYNCEVEYVDYCIGELIETLKDSRLLDGSIVILTADHGEGLGEHNVFHHFKHVLYEELIHIPLIVHGLNQREEIDNPVGLIDVAPTILSLLKIRKPKTFYGKSLLPLIRGEVETRNGVISESAHYNLKDFMYDLRKSVYSYRGKKWKLVLNNIKGTKELYNLQEDPHEQTNLFALEKDVVECLTKKLIKHIRWERRESKSLTVFSMRTHEST